MKKNDEQKRTVGKETAGKKIAVKQITGKETAKKKLAEMNLIEDFLFGSLVAYPKIGERFVRILLRTIFGREFKHLSVTAQKVLYGTDADLHGARLDVYLEPEIEEGADERVTVYDVEPDRRDGVPDKRALPRRVRFYHAKVVARDLNAGAEYDELKNVVIIMIMSYDPFGLSRMVYTVENRCVEEPRMLYDDGASTLFLYTKGVKGVPNEEVKQMLHYMEETTYENAVNKDLREIHEMVGVVKRDPETSLAYWKMMHKQKRDRAEAEEIGMARGMAQGMAQGMVQGMVKYNISLICKKMRKNKTLEEIAEALEEEISAIEPIYMAAKEFAPDYDPELVFKHLNEDKEDDAAEAEDGGSGERDAGKADGIK